MIFGVRGVCPLKFYYVNAEGANPLRLTSFGRKSRRLADDFRRARGVSAQILLRECRRRSPPPVEAPAEEKIEAFSR